METLRKKLIKEAENKFSINFCKGVASGLTTTKQLQKALCCAYADGYEKAMEDCGK